jgi:hypothetical protein
MSQSLRQLFVSMEDDTVNETDLVVSPDDTVEQEIAETAEAFSESEQAGDDQGELEEISDGLESIFVSMEAAMQDGGLNPQAALFMQHAVGSYTSRLGLKVSAVTPSLESFGGASGQAAATTISMEGIKETIKKIWQAIKNAVAKAIAAVKNFFAKIFGGAKKLKSRIEALKGKTGEAVDYQGKKVKVTGGESIAYKGKVDGASVSQGLGVLGELVQESWSELAPAAEKYYAAMGAVLADPKTQAALEESAISSAVESADGMFSTVAGKITSRSKEAAGGWYFSASAEGGAAGDDDSKGTLTLARKKPSINEGAEIDCPGPNTLRDILGHCSTIVETLLAKGSYMDKLNTAREKAVQTTEKFVNAAETGKLGKAWSNATVNRGLRKATKDLTRPLLQVNNAGFSAVRSALALVERSIAAAGKSEKKDDKKKDGDKK